MKMPDGKMRSLLRNERVLDPSLFKYSRVFDEAKWGHEDAIAGIEMGIRRARRKKGCSDEGRG
jgi:hypothetical protein